MLIFLLKSTACLAIFLAFYKLMLEKESVHHFKRYFLLVSLIGSFIIPNLVFTEYVDVAEPTLGTYTAIENMDSAALTEQPLPQPSSFDWELFLWLVYTLGVIGFGFRFMANLFQIRKRIKKNPKFKENFMTKVLLAQALPPHTFLNYIFLNQKQYRENSIPQEVLLHEETHAKQRHSLDILFIELAQVVFWFNPLIYLFKSSIKLNHEFLADKAVIRKEQNHSHYQNTLLSYLSNDIERHQSVGIANAINYSSIKKRFTVMKTNTSKTSFVFRSFLLLPLTALLLFGFSETKTIPRIDPAGLTETEFYAEKSIESKDGISTRSIQLAGLILDSETLLPIENAFIRDSEGSTLATTDNNGYYNIEFQISSSGEIFFDFNVVKEGYVPTTQIQHWGNLQGKISSAIYIGLRQDESNAKQLSSLVPNLKNLDYETILTNYSEVKKDFAFAKKVEASKRGNQNVFLEIDKGFYLLSDSWIRINSKDDLVLVDDETIVPAKKLNNIIKRDQIIGMTPLGPGSKANYVIYTSKQAKSDGQKTINPINIKINKNGQILFQKDLVPLSNLKETLFKINDHLSFDERKKTLRSVIEVDQNSPKNIITQVDQILAEYGSATINIVGAKIQQQSSATREEMKEYNTLAKKYNAMDRNHMTIKKSEVMRLKEIYGKMSEKQRADAEPFPDFPPPPPAPKAPQPPKNMSETEYASTQIKNIIDTQDPYDNLDKNTRIPISPDAPPAPPKPIEHIKKMMAKGATFMWNGEEISGEKAIEMVQKNKRIHIDSRESNGAKPVVKLSTDPIGIEN